MYLYVQECGVCTCPRSHWPRVCSKAGGRLAARRCVIAVGSLLRQTEFGPGAGAQRQALGGSRAGPARGRGPDGRGPDART